MIVLPAASVESMLYLTEISGAEQHLSWRSGARIPFHDVLAHAGISLETTCGAEKRINELSRRKVCKEEILQPGVFFNQGEGMIDRKK